MPRDDQESRLMERHQGNEAIVTAMMNFEKTLEKNGVYDEDISTVNLVLENNPTKDDVVKQILSIIENVRK